VPELFDWSLRSIKGGETKHYKRAVSLSHLPGRNVQCRSEIRAFKQEGEEYESPDGTYSSCISSMGWEQVETTHWLVGGP